MQNESRTIDEKSYTTSYADPAQGGAYVTFYTYDGAGNLISKSLPANAGSYNTWNWKSSSLTTTGFRERNTGCSV